jgi:hypothetical protein
MPSLPPAADREAILSGLDALKSSLEAHPSWPSGDNTAPPPPSLHHIWDFVKRSHYIMSELDNILEGRPLQHPEQIPSNGGGSGEDPASRSFGDVCSRSVMTNQMVQNPRMLLLMGLTQVDFGEDVRQKSAALMEVIQRVS